MLNIYKNKKKLLLVNHFFEKMQMFFSMSKALDSCILLICSTGMCSEDSKAAFVSGDEKIFIR